MRRHSVGLLCVLHSERAMILRAEIVDEILNNLNYYNFLNFTRLHNRVQYYDEIYDQRKGHL